MIDKMAELTRENERLKASTAKISAANEGLQQKLEDAKEREENARTSRSFRHPTYG